MSSNHNQKGRVVSQAEWIASSKAFLEREKAFTREREKLSRERQELPWLKIEKEYTFQSGSGPVTLAQLFNGRSQLVIYHFMFAPEWSQGCPGCSFMADHYNPAVVHLNNHDVSLVTVSRASIESIEAFKKRMQWSFPWVSSFGTSFNQDFNVSFTPEETSSGMKIYNHKTETFDISDAPGLSVFFRNDSGEVFLTYATFARGLDIFLTTYHLLDVSPKGRNEENGMGWVRHHDKYGNQDAGYPWVENPINSVKEK